jgi:hypothetical protein
VAKAILISLDIKTQPFLATERGTTLTAQLLELSNRFFRIINP